MLINLNYQIYFFYPTPPAPKRDCELSGAVVIHPVAAPELLTPLYQVWVGDAEVLPVGALIQLQYLFL
jgi:hypothetical protein